MNRKITVSFETINAGSFSCIMEDEFDKFGLIGYGKTAREAEADLFVALRETKEGLGDGDVPDIEIGFRKFDVGAFFSYYPFFNITQFSKFVGINAAQMRQYASGIRRPTKQKKDDINRAVRYIVETLFSESRAFCID
jgi:hypothetical protein